jgi:Domain of unknown function DUF11
MRRGVLTLFLICGLSLGVARAGIGPVDLSVTLRASKSTARVGDTISYAAAVRNRGPSAAVRAGVGFELRGPRVANARATASAGFCRRVPGAAPDVTCELRRPPLAAGDTLRFVLTARLEEPGSLQVYISDFSTTKDGDHRNDTAAVVTRVRPR